MPDGLHMLLDQVYHFIPLRNSSLTLVAGSRVDYHPASDPRTESSRRSSYYSGCKSDLESSLSHTHQTSSGRPELPSWACCFGFSAVGGHWHPNWILPNRKQAIALEIRGSVG